MIFSIHRTGLVHFQNFCTDRFGARHRFIVTMNGNNIGGSNHNYFSSNKRRKVGRPKKRNTSDARMARTNKSKLIDMYNNAQGEIFRLQNENKDLKQRIKYLEPAFESEETIDNACEKLKREALASKKQAIRYFESSIKTLKHHYGKSHTRKVLIK